MPNNISITQDTGNPYSESDIRVNPNNPLQIIAASNSNNGTTQAQYYSSDGGNTWGRSSLPAVSGDIFQSDPCVDWTSDGTAWALTIGVISFADLVVRCFKSTDGGKTWTHDSDVSGSQTATDKPTLWIDHSSTSSHQDNMYAIWHNGTPTFVSARNGPGGTWSAPLQVSGSETTFTSDGSDIKTNANGDVFAFWPNAGGNTMLVAKSTNGGTSFGALGANPIQIAATFGPVLLGIPAQDSRSAFGIDGCLKYISGGAWRTAAVDMVYACWADLAGGSGCNAQSDEPGSNVNSTCKTRIWFALSNNGGSTWQPAVKINDPSSLNDQFFPRLAVDETNGNLMIVYYDTVADPNRQSTDVWMQCSTDNGNTWTKAVKITSAETNEANANNDGGNQYGDYIGLTGNAGNFFACWTDRRGGGNEQIYGAPISMPSMYFIIANKNTFGADEVGNTPFYPNDFYVAVEGASPNSLGITNSPTLNNSFDQIGSIQLLPNTADGPLPFPTYELSTQLDTPQRILFPYNINFPSGALIPPFPSAGSAEIPYPLGAAISFQGGSLQAETLFELISGEDPYFSNVNPAVDNDFWLSRDLRVFAITPESNNATPIGNVPFTFQTGSPTQLDTEAAYSYIRGLLGYLNGNYSNPGGTDPFDPVSMVLPDQLGALNGDSSVTPASINWGDLLHPYMNYNFAVARVRLKGTSNNQAQNVKVFFRVFGTQTNDTDYINALQWVSPGDPNITYPSAPANAPDTPATPLPGTNTGGTINGSSLPFFAASDQSDLQPNGANNRMITIPAGGGIWVYYGCFLNVYDPTNLVGSQTIQHWLAGGTHHCIVAQIAYDNTPIENSNGVIENPENSDKLAQRNLTITPSGNPGYPSTHRVPQTFDIRPTTSLFRNLKGAQLDYPDELMIDWGNTPAGSQVSIYWPQVNAAEVLQLAASLYAAKTLSASDSHTLQCTVSNELTFIPIPVGSGQNFAGLFTVDLPSHIRVGNEFNIIVRRITTRRINQGKGQVNEKIDRFQAEAAVNRQITWRYVVGTFQIRIPVQKESVMLLPEENLLAILKWRLQLISTQNRWYKVLIRYIGYVSDRIRGMGGDPSWIKPSSLGIANQAGNAPGFVKQHEKEEEYTGKVAGILYDRFGDFEGFILETREGHEHSFHGRERDVEELIYRAWEKRFLITVYVHPSRKNWPASILFRQP
ncbi:MAG TPA: sialidase family protein [Puia sp.]|jgi:hypothetical protein|nr:sialidase family protein [Puia sp.]